MKLLDSSSKSWWNGAAKDTKVGSKKILSIQSKSNNELQQIAEMQFAAMNQYGTDEDLLFNSLKDLNSKDMEKVFNYFGERDYEKIQGNSQPIFGEQSNIFIWYANELNQKELDKMRKIWEKAELNISF